MLTLESLMEELTELLGKYDELFTEETDRSYVIAFSEKGLNGVYSAHAGRRSEIAKIILSTTNQVSHHFNGILHAIDPEGCMVDLLNRGVDEVNALTKSEGVDFKFPHFALEEEDSEVDDEEYDFVALDN